MSEPRNCGGSLDTVTDVMEKELGDGSSVLLKQGLFDVTNIAGAHARAHGYTFKLKKVRGVYTMFTM